MKIEKVFKSLIIFYGIFFFLCLYFFWNISLEVFLYGEIFEENYNKISNAFPETKNSSLLSSGLEVMLLLFLIIILYVSLYRLFKFKSYARELFIFYLLSFNFMSYVLYVDPSHMTLYTEPQEWSLSLLYMAEGAIIVFIYFTAIKDKFKKKL